MKLKVRQGTQVKHNGTLYKGGEEFTANDSDADSYIRQGWAEEVAKKPAKRTGPTRAQSEAAAEDKAPSFTVTRSAQAEGKPLSPPRAK